MSEMERKLTMLTHLTQEEADQIATHVLWRKNSTSNGGSASQASTAQKPKSNWPSGLIPAKSVRFNRTPETPVVKQGQYCEVKKLSTEVLASLWGAKYGFAWVALKELSKDDLYCAIATQLLKGNYVERVTTKDNSTSFRLLDF